MKTIETAHITSLLHSRLYVNQLIRFIFDQSPEKSKLLSLIEEQAFMSLCEISSSCQLIRNEIRSMQTNGEKQKQLKEEYNRLFVGPNALPAPLWESVYLGKEHLMFEQETLQVRNWYHQYGLSFIRENNEPDDHIVLELEFLGFLIQQTLEAYETEKKLQLIEDQYSFLNQHLLVWTPSFCELLNKVSKVDLYKGAAQLLLEYLNLENELVLAIKEALHYE